MIVFIITFATYLLIGSKKPQSTSTAKRYSNSSEQRASSQSSQEKRYSNSSEQRAFSQSSQEKRYSNSSEQRVSFQSSQENVETSISNKLKSFSLNDLKEATKNFRREYLIGEGGFGRIFKGWIDENTYAPTKPGSGIVVAIKNLKQESFQGHKEWLVCVTRLIHLSENIFNFYYIRR